ncbi:MAG: transglycosylase domain-containing protein [Myxococcales bacterium]|nr:transglycosylase domain-containing protein [Myxococcales bacterium]MDH3483950.1 transglycosylase domain-containing protein [Myxococcales bacterium]
MLRFLSERRAWVVAVGLVSILAMGIWTWGARHAAARASELIHDRFGLDVDIAAADLGLRGVELRDVELRGRGGGLVVRADRVNARVSPIGALFLGARAVNAIHADGIDVSVDLGHPGIEASLSELESRLAPRRSSSNTTSVSTGKGREYAMTDLTVRVRDRQGALVQMRDIDLSKKSNELRSSIAETLIGEASGDHARVGPTTFSLHRENETWVLRELSVDGASVRWLGDAVGGNQPLALRIREALQAIRASRPAPKPDDAAAPASDAVHDARPRFLSRLSVEPEINLSNLAVESQTPDGRVERVQDLAVELTGSGDGWFRLLMGGQTSNEGALNVDLRVQPSEARAEGNVIVRGISLALVAPFVPAVPFYDAEAGTVTAEIGLRADSPDRVRIEGKAALRNAALFSERIAPEPIEKIGFDLRGEGAWFPAQRRLVIEQARVRLADAHVLVNGELERTTEHYRADLTASLPPTPCNDVVGAIPRDVLGDLRGFAWSGNWSALAHIALDSRDLEAAELSIRVRDLCEFERIPRWVRVERFRQPFRHKAVEPDESIFTMVTGPETPAWVPLVDISPFLIEAVISHEDARFYDHGGFAPWAIRDALVRNLQEGRYVVGASTISMQLAKNLYLRREKTLARKVQEVILTWWLENALSKDEILELYLNVIEYGPGIYGLKNAALHYFGRMPSDLSPAEAAFLACILPSPKRYHLYYERDALTRSIRGKMGRLLEHMAKRQRIGPEALVYGLAELEHFDFQQDEDPPPLPRILPPLGVTADEVPEPDPYEVLFLAP